MTAGSSNQPVVTLRDSLRTALKTAMKARDRGAISALRSALAAIDNAEAVDIGDVRAGALEGSAVGLGAAEVRRRELTEDDVVEIVRREINERRITAGEYDRLGAVDQRDQVTTEADVLSAFL
ncbi:GatB/YqeY domain-containing protein [Nocardia caishijiensis]|uniref:GatB/YqeY domain-containing protein n=1 Tax=Nocardia caishijiensis TaxID=184756 RepID=A0ABQ6YPY8_9NOCA|nr:GatB/YqeY domain-containing protein [Nocardia caishijiensis]KAF0847845.1 hypothetical protein FNL39_103747 [Nocardia caishijiensis]